MDSHERMSSGPLCTDEIRMGIARFGSIGTLCKVLSKRYEPMPSVPNQMTKTPIYQGELHVGFLDLTGMTQASLS
jgi:hypothetical protein